MAEGPLVVIHALEELQHRLQAYHAIEQMLLDSKQSSALSPASLAVLIGTLTDSMEQQCRQAIAAAREQVKRS